MVENEIEDRKQETMQVGKESSNTRQKDHITFIQSTYPYPVCNHTSNEVDSCNIGYAQGILVDGVPFEAELWKDSEGGLVALSIYLPELKELYEDWDETEIDFDIEDDNIIGFEKTLEINWEAVLCIGMVEREIDVDDEELNNYVEYLIRMGLVTFESELLNGNLHYLTDIEGNDIVSVEIVLEEDGYVCASTPLQFTAFPNNLKKNRFKIIK